MYVDESIVVVDKPSGVLSVPGPRRNPNIAKLVQTYYNNNHNKNNNTDYDLDRMIVHRLDMDTSGIIVFAKITKALQALHDDFRPTSKAVHKVYEALVCGHVGQTIKTINNSNDTNTPYNVMSLEGEIDLPLQRDATSPPFMCVATTANNYQTNHPSLSFNSAPYQNRFHKMMSKAPKSSLTYYQILFYEYLQYNNDNKYQYK